MTQNHYSAALAGGLGTIFLLIAGIIAIVYADGASQSIVLPVLVGLIGPTVAGVLAIMKTADNNERIAKMQEQVQDVQNKTDPLLMQSAVKTAVTEAHIAEAHEHGTS